MILKSEKEVIRSSIQRFSCAIKTVKALLQNIPENHKHYDYLKKKTDISERIIKESEIYNKRFTSPLLKREIKKNNNQYEFTLRFQEKFPVKVNQFIYFILLINFYFLYLYLNFFIII